MDISKIKRDVNLMEKAIGDIDLLIASSGNKKYKEMIRKEVKPYERQMRSGTLADEVFEEIQTKCLAHCVLLGWHNLSEGGVDVPYSAKKAYDLLKDPENIDFRKLVIDLSDEAEVFRKESVEETTFQA
jgi:hypothetical protein